MKRKIVSVAVIMMVFFATFGIGLVMADDDVNETTEAVDETADDDVNETTEAVDETTDIEGETTEEQEEESDEDITEAEEELTEAEAEVDEKTAEGLDVTQSEGFINEAKTLLAHARDAKHAGEYKKARKLAREAKKVAKQGKRGKAFKNMKLLHLYDVFFHQMEKHRIGMEAIIDYVNEKGEGTEGSEQLVIIKDSFVALEGELEAAANASDDREFKKILKDSRGLTKDFREESHRVLGAESEIGAARTKVNEALKENKDYLQALLDNIRQTRKESELEILDEANDKIQERIEHIKKKGRDIEKLLAKLEEMKKDRDALKEKLEAAIASCEGASIGDCDTAEAQEYRALKEEIKDGYKELRTTSKKTGQTHRISNAIKMSRKVLERVETHISQAEERGVDVTAAKAKFDGVTEMLDSAEAKYNEGDYKGALEELKNAKEALKGSGIKRLLNAKSEAIGKGKERREGAIDKAEERRDDAIEKGKERREEAIDKAEERRKEALENATKRREEAIEDGKAF